MPDLLLELFSEEIPARMQARAADDLQRLMNERLLAAGLLPEGVKAFAGPRRLTLLVTGLPLQQADRKEEKKGPRVGAPQGAIDGFLKSAGLTSLDQCVIEEDKKGQYYVARLDRPGRATAEIIAEAVPAIVREFPWPKSMRWGDGDLTWVRPLKSVLCCFDNEVAPFEIGAIVSGDTTRGHRSAGGGVIHARNFDKYVVGLTNAKVMLDGAARRDLIAADAKTLCEAQGLALVEDKGLLAEVAGLAEWPVVMMGAFDAKFLALPDEVLTASMRGHQKYFSVKDPKTGRLANKFVFVANIEAADGGASMRKGYERVLTARLSDAWYLYQQDLKRPLEDRIADLDRVTFFEGLGSIGDKALLVVNLVNNIGNGLGANPLHAEQAARLSKADLTTGMVYEFPELQGLMGRYYYLAQHAPSSPARGGGEREAAGEGPSQAKASVAGARPLSHAARDSSPASGGAEEIADAIRDHYAPKGEDDSTPESPVARTVALADKLVTLVGFWTIGKRPTGSGDPFALRRAALGVIRILIDSGQSLNPMNLVGWLLNYHFKIPTNTPRHTDLKSDLLDFFHDRMKVYFRNMGYRHDHIAAALIGPGGRPEEVPYKIKRKINALSSFLKTDDGANLAAGFKRAANILKAEEKKGASSGALSVDTAKLQQAEEKALHAALAAAEAKATAAVAAEKFAEAMTALSTLRAPIDAFFDKVTVNADDPALRANRLALLQRFIAATAAVADLSKLEG
ncbi:MAG: glycine--tRNA ligase subunit beta [Parvularculaceae bacterium]|nr:glycine--tRNA ligase subunit beta [Parvularculaceae bacterium]